jgi:MFS family permease
MMHQTKAEQNKTMEKKQYRRRTGLLVIACLYTPLLAGAFCGWGPFQLLFEENGNFSSRCSEASQAKNEICPEQKAALLNIPLISQSLAFGLSPAIGWFCDRFGAPSVGYLMSASFVVGLTLIFCAARFLIDALVLPGFILFGIGGLAGSVLTVQSGMIYRNINGGKTRSRVIFILNNLFDSGAMTSLLLWYLTQWIPNGKATMANVMGSYLGVALAILIPACFLWGLVKPVDDNDEKEPLDLSGDIEMSICEATIDIGGQQPSDDFESEGIRPDQEKKDVEEVAPSLNNEDDVDPETLEEVPRSHRRREGQSVKLELSVSGEIEMSVSGEIEMSMSVAAIDRSVQQPTDDVEPEGIRQDQEKRDVEEVPPSLNNEDDVDPETIEKVPRSHRRRRGQSVTLPDGTEYVLISQKAPSKQLRSAPFLLLCVYFAIQMCINLWTLTTARDFLAYLGDDEYNNRYLTIFTLLTPVSIIGIPFVDVTLQKFGYHGGMQAVNILAILQGIIKVSSDNLNVQIVGFLFYSFYRSFLFSVCFSFVPTILSMDAMGKGTGILTFFGILSFVNAPIANVVIKHLDGNFFIPNLAYTLMGIPCIIIAYYIERKMKPEHAARKEIQRLRQSMGGVMLRE